MRSFTFVIIALGALVACRDSNSKAVDGSIDSAPTLTIQQVQSDTITPSTPVSLSGVIVTAIDEYGAKTGDIWVEEPEGGPFSGVHVYKGDPAVVSTLAIGDKVDITNAVKASFALSTDMTGRTETELEPPASGGMVMITKTGTGTVPGPDMVNALAIGMMDDANNNGARSMAWRQWDGVLIKVTSVTQTTSVAQIGGATPDPTLQKFGITGAALVESSLSAFPASGIAFNSCLGSVTGVLSYFFDYQILQRNTSDIVTGGTGCPAPENSPALCSDSVDNDGNGFTDCSDNNCVVGDTACRNTTTINAVDTATDSNPMMPTLPAGNPVGVQVGNGGNTDVYVTAISSNNKYIWVALNKAGTADQGLEVFNSSGTLPTGVAVGAKVNVIGTLKAYNNDTQGETLPELDQLQVNVSGNPTGTAPSGTTQTIATLTTPATGRPWVGSLVSIANVKIVSVPDPANHLIAMLQSGTTMFEAEADIHSLTSAANTCFGTITGIWTYDVYNNVYALEPTGEGTGTGTCP
jgi:hypothetical protein